MSKDKMNMKKNDDHLTMCWFGFTRDYATSVVHHPSQEISPDEISDCDMIFVWDKYMKSDIIYKLLSKSVPWSPALIEGYSRNWKHLDNGNYIPELIKNDRGRCLGAVLLTKRLSEEDLIPLVRDYQDRGYALKEVEILAGDLIRIGSAFLP